MPGIFFFFNGLQVAQSVAGAATPVTFGYDGERGSANN